MKSADQLGFALRALVRHPLRTGLILLAVAVGGAAVIALAALGEGARRFVSSQFSALGTHLLIVIPGRSETTGGPPPILGETPRDLTIDDALALQRIGMITRLAPVTVGAASVSVGRRNREVLIIGSTSEFRELRHLRLAQGRFLPELDPRRAAPVAVIGHAVRAELFGSQRALGEWLRVEDRRFRVIGVLASGGQSVGLDLDDMVVVPLGAAQQLFNTSSLFRILAQAASHSDLAPAERAILSIIRERHEGEDDVTVITQESVVATFDRVLRVLTVGVSGIGAISLAVAGVLIMNVMLISVSQRSAEIGLLKAVGATPAVIRRLFLTEAALLALAGALAGLSFGFAGVWLVGRLYPTFPISVPLWSVFGTVAVALVTALGFALIPANRAARLDPVRALTGR